jgi:glycosyltransferase involved in cell wall biosynthesis
MMNIRCSASGAQNWYRDDGSCRVLGVGYYADLIGCDRLAEVEDPAQTRLFSLRGRFARKLVSALAHHPAATAWRLTRAQRTYEVVLTAGAPLSLWYSLLQGLCLRRPRSRHVAVEFFLGAPTRWSVIALWPILRAVTRWCLNRVDAIMVHSFAETAIYQDYYALQGPMLFFTPFGARLDLLRTETVDGHMVVAAGRDSRDFRTFLEAVRPTSVPAAVIAPRGAVKLSNISPNVVLHEDIGGEQYLELLRTAAMVVVPLENKARSLGQVVLVNAMALGKPVIATRTVGTVDYITHGQTGVLVPPYDPIALRQHILWLMDDRDSRRRLGAAARSAASTFRECHMRALRSMITWALQSTGRRQHLDGRPVPPTVVITDAPPPDASHVLP